ncbi:hypothetical protein GCM10011317_52770 [Niveispirillum cyanobacteriorum]|nr:hypothetical protein GCM10011317_52770 [Niveispirillum cyanobacteriorum]
MSVLRQLLVYTKNHARIGCHGVPEADWWVQSKNCESCLSLKWFEEWQLAIISTPLRNIVRIR